LLYQSENRAESLRLEDLRCLTMAYYDRNLGETLDVFRNPADFFGLDKQVVQRGPLFGKEEFFGTEGAFREIWCFACSRGLTCQRFKSLLDGQLGSLPHQPLCPRLQKGLAGYRQRVWIRRPPSACSTGWKTTITNGGLKPRPRGDVGRSNTARVLLAGQFSL
jgi:hypothetical protein